MAVKLSLTITQNSQNITNNTSNVTVKAVASWTYGSWNHTGECVGYIIIDGTKYSFSNVILNPNRTTSGSGTVMTKTVDVKHGSDGKKTLSCSASFSTYVSSGTISASASKTLTTIPRKSTLSVGNGTLGTGQTLTVTKQASGFTHTIVAACGSETKTICTKSSSTSITFTPPLAWASNNTTGVSVSVKYTITTYNGDSSLGSNSYTKTCSIPDSVIPSCTIEVTDPTGYVDTYGGYIQSQSKFKVVVTPTLAYNSPVASYSVSANGVSYSKSSFTTDVIKSSGNLSISAVVKDKRGRSSKKVVTNAEVIAYNIPAISKLTVGRCDADGKAHDQGDHIMVTFDYTVVDLDNKNTATCALRYKKTSDGKYTEITFADLNNVYESVGQTYIFEADTGSSYDVVLAVTDNFKTATKTAIASTGFTLMHWKASGYGMAVGKISELDDVFDIGMQTRMMGGILHPVLKPDTDLNDVRTPNTYVGANVSNYNYLNCPLTSGTFTLEVVGMGEEGQVKQQLTYCHKTDSRVWERIYYSSAWGEWICVSDFDGELLWEGAFFMHDTQEITLSEPISKQRAGIVLVFCRYSSGTVQNYHFSYHFVPKMAVAMHSGCGSVFQMGAVEGDYFASKYLYISDQKIKGNEYNDNVITDANNGITYTNNATVLRYVIGV